MVPYLADRPGRNGPRPSSGTRWAILLLVAASGCADGDAGAAGPTVLRSDSAGVEIVMNREETLPRWRVGEPTVRIGVLEGSQEYELSRVAYGRRLADGRIVIGDGGSRELRVFDASGTFERAIGGPGEGPGEFGFPGNIFPRGDTLRVWDPRLRRLTDFDARDGRFLQLRSIGADVLNANMVTLLEDGYVVLQSPQFVIPDTGFELNYSEYVGIHPDGETRDTLPRQPHARMGRIAEGRMVGGPTFGFRASAAGDETGYWVGIGNEPEVRRFDASGLRRIIRWPDHERDVGPGDLEAYIEDEVAQLPAEARAEQRRTVHAIEVADRFPVFREMHGATDGAVWVKRFQRPGDDGPEEWEVFDSDGVRAAVVELPRGIRLLEVTRESVLAVLRDELDVERVQLLPIESGDDDR